MYQMRLARVSKRTPVNNTIMGKPKTRALKNRDTSGLGLFSGVLNMCLISGRGPSAAGSATSSCLAKGTAEGEHFKYVDDSNNKKKMNHLPKVRVTEAISQETAF